MNLFGGVSAECHEGRANVFWVNPYRQKVIPIRVTCHRFGERESKILGFFRVCVSHSIISTPEYLELFRSCFIKVSSIGGPLDYLNRPVGQSSHSNDPYFTMVIVVLGYGVFASVSSTAISLGFALGPNLMEWHWHGWVGSPVNPS